MPRLLLALALVLPSSPTPPSPRHRPLDLGCKPLSFEGTVHAGQSFHHPLSGSLELVLDPSPNGWTVRVWPLHAPHSAQDLAELATPPFRSINPLILTTDFGLRAQDAIGWNPRTFFFLPDIAAVPGAQRAYTAVLATPHPTPAQQAAVARAIADRTEAQLTILDAEILPGSADQTPAAAAVAQHLGRTPFHSLAGSRSATPAGEIGGLRFRVSIAPGQGGNPGAPCRPARP